MERLGMYGNLPLLLPDMPHGLVPARQLLQRLRPRADAPRPVVSPREQEVLEHLTKGFTAEEIAGLMAVSRHIVLTFVRRVFKKLGVGSKAEAIYEAHRLGLIER
jgi:DNA-binding NarL/FixJ family response regulator